MRLIDVDALIAEYDRVHVGAPGGARKLMVEAPIVEADLIRYAYWNPDDYDYFHCSDCGYEQDEREKVTKFCPGCGAHMDEPEETKND